jgi:nucleotide-binding universal stress UspA family protein
MYTKILVPLDGSRVAEQILPYARLWAKTYAIPLELLRVDDPDIRPPFWPPLPSRDYLKEVSARYLPVLQPVASIEQVGKPAEVIVERAEADPACLIALATHGLSGPRRWLLGSVAGKVARGTTNPLLFIRPTEGMDPATDIELKTVFVPLDGSGLAEKVLPHILPLVKKMKLEVHLVRVYTLPADAYVVGDGVFMQALAQQREMMKNEAETYLEGKTQQLRAEGLDRVISTAIEGDPAGEIIDLACKTPNNLIAMSSHGRSGVGRWILGSVTEKVIHHSRDPVLIIRPASNA